MPTPPSTDYDPVGIPDEQDADDDHNGVLDTAEPDDRDLDQDGAAHTFTFINLPKHAIIAVGGTSTATASNRRIPAIPNGRASSK